MGPKWERKSEQNRKNIEKGDPKIDEKNDAKFGGVGMAESIAPWSPKERFWSWRGGKEGTSPSGTGDFGFDSVIQSKTPCTRRGAADTF